MPNLRDRVAIVTGASRGAGRGIAVELGAAGATVYVTPPVRRLLAGGGAGLDAHRAHPRRFPGERAYVAGASPARPHRVAALAADPDVAKKSGTVQLVGELAREYGFTDLDGRVIPPFEMPS